MAKDLIASFGEMLIDFVPTVSGVSLAEAPGFIKAPGGAPANVAIAVARLGGRAAFVGKLGDDEFGRMLAGILRDNGVDDGGVLFDTGARTALAFVTLRADGEREFMFYRNPSADMLLTEAELNLDVIKSVSACISLSPCSSSQIRRTQICASEIRNLPCGDRTGIASLSVRRFACPLFWDLSSLGCRLPLRIHKPDNRPMPFGAPESHGGGQTSRSAALLRPESALAAVALAGVGAGADNEHLGPSRHHQGQRRRARVPNRAGVGGRRRRVDPLETGVQAAAGDARGEGMQILHKGKAEDLEFIAVIELHRSRLTLGWIRRRTSEVASTGLP
ncbi:hypothetical protein BHE74_00004386 [Ensete ventricosum]|nr:hypothetical protein GW17_00008623 [Ensete ventricosum]RWW86824.1 hypothetical protein BHE74_00004386 [Ensete ventricosum]RZR81878.1 hypothetical protein BHM03_00008184 [Ensete ventricosum]